MKNIFANFSIIQSATPRISNRTCIVLAISQVTKCRHEASLELLRVILALRGGSAVHESAKLLISCLPTEGGPGNRFGN